MQILEEAKRIIREKGINIGVDLPIAVERRMIGDTCGDTDEWYTVYSLNVNKTGWSCNMNANEFMPYVKEACDFVVKDIKKNLSDLNNMVSETPLTVELQTAYSYIFKINGKSWLIVEGFDKALEIINAFYTGFVCCKKKV